MAKEKFLIVGSGGRESAFATKLAAECELYAVVDHANGSIVAAVAASGGQHTIGKSDDPQVVLSFAQQHAVDYVFVSADNPLAAGVVDVLLAHNIKAVGATQAAARIEWDKMYSIDMVKAVRPQHTPAYEVATDATQVAAAVKQFADANKEIVVKPQGLTGGKGVQVMGEHLQNYDEAAAYATTLINKDGAVLLTEKLRGFEFTIMGLTDGTNLVLAPATYDYPYRYDGDRGKGTGGMGCFTAPDHRLPFLTEGDIATCRDIMQAVLDSMRADGLHFNGVLNGGFFKTAEGIRFMEFNGRFGDPEALNILMLLQSSFAALIKSMWEKNLNSEAVQFAEQASVVKYLVAPEYPDPSPESSHYEVDEAALAAANIHLFYASTVQSADKTYYETLKKSRVLALGALAPTIPEAADTINTALATHIKTIDGNALEYRQDIGTPASLQTLS